MSYFLFIFLGSFFTQDKQLDPHSRRATEISEKKVEQTRLGIQPEVALDSVPQVADSVAAPVGDIKSSIVYTAEDSINMDVEAKIVRLYGHAKVTYEDIKLQAEEIEINYETSTIRAQGRLDSAGRRIGYPVFSEGGQVYETREIQYNFKTRRAKILEVVTKQGDGLMRGKELFKTEQNVVYAINNTYTTCDLPSPHFRVLAYQTKAIPDDKLITGPFYMEFNKVPMPLGFLFGIFPSQRKSNSGIIVPKYGEEGRRGFFLRQGGYYLDISDYIKMAITADVYTRGSSAVQMRTNYIKRYRFSGNLNLSYTNNVYGNQIEALSRSKDFRLNWSHAPISRRASRFSASVNIFTSSYLQNNFIGLNRGVQAGQPRQDSRTTSSNISYSKTFRGTPFNMGINLSHSQNLVTKQVDLSLPRWSVNMNNVYPAESSSILWLKNLGLSYRMNMENKITNRYSGTSNGVSYDSIVPFAGENLSSIIRRGKMGVQHHIPMNTSFKIMRFFVMNSSVNYEETWYLSKLQWGLSAEDQSPVVVDTLPGFNRLNSYSFGAGINTRIFGTFLSKRPHARIKAIRHVLNPSISYSYRPDFSKSRYGYYQSFEVGAQGESQLVKKSLYEGYLYGTPSAGENSSLGMTIGNSVEMKVRKPKDSVDRKISLLNSFVLSSSYNFKADSMKLSRISMSGSTSIFNDKISVNFSGILDPYKFYYTPTGEFDEENKAVYQERQVDELVWKNLKLGRLTQATMAFSTNINPQKREREQQIKEKVNQSDIPEGEKQEILQHADRYIDFSIPWSLQIGYNLIYSHRLNSEPSIEQGMQFSGDLSLSEKWKIIFNSGYDFKNGELTQTFLQLNRDLHCWNMSLGWVPFGQFQSYTFSIRVKSSILSSLKLDRNRSFFDN